MGFTELFGAMVETVATRLLSTSDLQESKSEVESDLKDAREGAFLNNEEAIKDCEKEIDRIDKELARRSR